MDCCEADNEPLGFVKGLEFLDQRIDFFCQFCAVLCVYVLSYCGVKWSSLLLYTFSFAFIMGICKGTLFCLASHITVHWELFDMTACSIVLTTNPFVLVQCIVVNMRFLPAKLWNVLEMFSLDSQAHIIANKHVYCWQAVNNDSIHIK
jgi:hypothetical protein